MKALNVMIVNTVRAKNRPHKSHNNHVVYELLSVTAASHAEPKTEIEHESL